MSKGHVRPDHLAPYLDLWRRIDAGEPVRAVITPPPRHGKTETTLHGLIWHLGRHPKLKSIYVGYNENFVREGARIALRIAADTGIQFQDNAKRLMDWKTVAGGGLFCTTTGGALTGKGVTGVAVIDDPIRSMEDARSATRRQALWSWWESVLRTRLEDNASVLVVHTRWHPDDLAGRLLEGGEWEHIDLPAIRTDDEGDEHALWPEKWPLDKLLALRDGGDGEDPLSAYVWAALYQGQPRPDGMEVFRQPATCSLSDIPNTGRVSIGVDLAYSTKRISDYSVAVVLRQAMDGTVYVVDVVRKQCEPTVFVETLLALRDRYRAPMRWHASGVEKGSADFIKAKGVPLHVVAATSDKFQRAMPSSAAWNSGRIVVPADASWAPVFIDEHVAFTGTGDRHDDQVDALSSAFDGLPKGSGKALTGGARTFGGRMAPPRQRNGRQGGRGKWLPR